MRFNPLQVLIYRIGDRATKHMLYEVADCLYFFSYKAYEVLNFGFGSSMPKVGGGRIKAAIVLNGGSLNVDGVKKLGPAENVFVCNEFCMTPEFLTIKPGHYILADQVFYSEQLKNKSGVVKANAVEVLNQRVDWDMELYVPLEAKGSNFQKKIYNENIAVKYFSKAPMPFSGRLGRLFITNLRSMPVVANVSVPAVALALAKGYGVLEIYGLDMSFYRNFSVNIDNVSYIESSYFYKSGERSPYMLSSKRLGGYVRGRASTFFRRMYETIRAHEIIASSFEGKVSIINKSQTSVVDVYPKSRSPT